MNKITVLILSFFCFAFGIQNPTSATPLNYDFENDFKASDYFKIACEHKQNNVAFCDISIIVPHLNASEAVAKGSLNYKIIKNTLNYNLKISLNSNASFVKDIPSELKELIINSLYCVGSSDFINTQDNFLESDSGYCNLVSNSFELKLTFHDDLKGDYHFSPSLYLQNIVKYLNNIDQNYKNEKEKILLKKISINFLSRNFQKNLINALIFYKIIRNKEDFPVILRSFKLIADASLKKTKSELDSINIDIFNQSTKVLDNFFEFLLNNKREFHILTKSNSNEFLPISNFENIIKNYLKHMNIKSYIDPLYSR